MVYPVLRVQYQQEREARTLAAELESLKDRNADLREQVDALKTPEGVERIARESLGLVKPGEQAYIVTGGASEDTSVTAYGATADDRSLAERMLDAIFGFR
jgi:cell division protein FtsB